MFSQKIKSIKLKDYFEIIKPQYKILKLTPDTSIRNYNSTKIAKSIQYMYRGITQRIKKQNKKLFIESPVKCSFFIDINKNDVQFYFIIPNRYIGLIKEKIISTWNKITIEEVDSLPSFTTSSLKYQLNYKKEDALSLRLDKKTNEPLNSILNVIDIMEETDRVGIFYNFMPINQLGWKKQYQDTINKIKNKKPIDREKFNIKYIFKEFLVILIDILQDIMDVLNDFTGGKTKSDNPSLAEIALSSLMVNDIKQLDKATVNKKDNIILSTQMMVCSDSNDIIRKENNAISVLESYKTITEDNELIYKKVNTKKNKSFNISDFKIAGVEENNVSIEECQNFIQLPGRNLLNEHKMIKKVDTLENKVPEELQQGYIRLGLNKFKDKKINAYMSDDKDLANLGLYIMGKQGSGKSEYFKNIAYDIINNKEGLTVIDYIKNCDLANSIEQITPKDRLIIIDLSKEECLQGFGFNEIKINNDMTAFKILEASSLQTQLSMELINSIYVGDPLSGQMRRYFSSASNLVYSYPNRSLKDVIDCLEYPDIRHNYIDNLRPDLEQYLQSEIRTLKTLDNVKETKDKVTKEVRTEIVGTNEGYIKFILDRINLLQEDFKLKMMFNKSIDNNIDFVNEMEKGSIILIKIPQAQYPLPHHKNVLATFFMSKLWLATQIRGSLHDRPLRHSFMIDEISLAPNLFRVLLPILTQLRKFQLKPILSGHYLKQIEPIKEALKASGCSYMLLKGTDKKNYQELENELKPYELEDLLNLKEYSSLNLIATKSETYAKFITKLPKPISKNKNIK